MLTQQYRMHSHIMEAVNQFYDHKLVQGCHDNEREHMLDAHQWLPRPEAHLAWIDTSVHVDWLHEQKGSSKSNPEEACLIISTLKEIVQNLVAKQQSLSIGIISVYRAQTRLLQNLLQKEKEQDEDFQSLLATIKVDIGTVDAFQGQDLDIILLSLVLNSRDMDLSSTLRRK